MEGVDLVGDLCGEVVKDPHKNPNREHIRQQLTDDRFGTERLFVLHGRILSFRVVDVCFAYSIAPMCEQCCEGGQSRVELVVVHRVILDTLDRFCYVRYAR